VVTVAEIEPGTRVRSGRWTGYDGTALSGVDPDGYVIVQWDRAGFSQDQAHVSDLAVIAGHAEPVARVAEGWAR
jgi:hypothetical protein